MKKWDSRIDEFQPFFRKLLAEVRLQNLGKDFAQWSGLEGAENRLRLGIDKAAESLKRRTEKNTLAHISSQIVKMPPQDVARWLRNAEPHSADILPFENGKMSLR